MFINLFNLEIKKLWLYICLSINNNNKQTTTWKQILTITATLQQNKQLNWQSNVSERNILAEFQTMQEYQFIPGMAVDAMSW